MTEIENAFAVGGGVYALSPPMQGDRSYED